ncbi:hypothetical protein [Nitrincola sp.]|uniref:hypothetical protein n=1 Tax=Nitrincola sp. TaxID=1926584 RepID=UPI003A8E3DED
MNTVINGVGLYTPLDDINHDELVESFNCFIAGYYTRHSAGIVTGEVTEIVSHFL